MPRSPEVDADGMALDAAAAPTPEIGRAVAQLRRKCLNEAVGGGMMKPKDAGGRLPGDY